MNIAILCFLQNLFARPERNDKEGSRAGRTSSLFLSLLVTSTSLEALGTFVDLVPAVDGLIVHEMLLMTQRLRYTKVLSLENNWTFME